MNKINWLMVIIISLVSVTGFVAAAPPAVLHAGDRISIWVKGEPELSVERQIGQDGSITLPLVGSVGVNGMKTTDAARMIAQLLEDGFLKDPLVQITLKGRAPGQQRSEAASVATPASPGQAAVPTATTGEAGKLLIEVVDASTKKGIGSVALMLGNKIYQSNRLGQILLDENSGYAVVIADGFQTAAGRFEEMLKQGTPARLHLQRVKLADAVTFTVIDAFTRQPLPNVEVTLDGMKITTNRQGAFKISLIKREFGEITLKRRGYRLHRQIVDYKGPEEQTVMMVRDE